MPDGGAQRRHSGDAECRIAALRAGIRATRRRVRLLAVIASSPGRIAAETGQLAGRRGRAELPGSLGRQPRQAGRRPPGAARQRRQATWRQVRPAFFPPACLHLLGRRHAAAAKPHRLAMPASGPRLPPPIAFITSAMFRCILRSWLMSSTLVPEPAAMRFLRLALRMSGCRRSCARHRIDDRDLALEHALVEIGGGDLVLHLGDAGQHAHQPADAAHLLHLLQLLAQVVEIELRPCACARRCARPSRHRWWRPPSRPATRCRPCRECGRRCGPDGNPPARRVFSPVPMSLIGLPVTARIESAAPPRPSPSTRVSTMPVRPTRSSNERARLTASWPVRRRRPAALHADWRPL